MNTPKLPPLPEPSWPFGCKYNEKDMQAYAIAAIKAQGVPDGFIQWLKARAADSYSCSLLVKDALVMLASSQPAPQCAIAAQGVPDVDDLRDRLVAISSAVAHSDDREAQAIIRTTLECLASAPPAPQAEELALWKARALQAEAIVSKFMEPQPLSETNPLNYDSSPTDEGCAALYRAHGIKE